MLPKFISCFVVTTIVAGLPLALGAASASAQSVTGPRDDDQQVAVVDLRTAEVNEVIGVLEQIYQYDHLTLTGLPAMQRIVISGSADLVQKAQQIAQDLDGPKDKDAASRQTALIQVHSYPVEDMLRLVHQSLLSTRVVRLAADSINRQIVVTGSPHDVQIVRELVTQVDKPTQALTADFFFLRGQIGEPASGAEGVLPAFLKPIATTLADNGFAAPTLLAPF